MQIHNFVMLVEHLRKIIVYHQSESVILLFLVIHLHAYVVQKIGNILLGLLEDRVSIFIPNFISQFMDVL